MERAGERLAEGRPRPFLGRTSRRRPRAPPSWRLCRPSCQRCDRRRAALGPHRRGIPICFKGARRPRGRELLHLERKLLAWLLGPLFDRVGRRILIALTYAASGALMIIAGVGLTHGWFNATSQTVMWSVVFFVASAAAS